jgi:HlyD family type I secretion membrane fusion protein
MARDMNLRRAVCAPVIAGLAILMAFFGGLIIWSAYAPLSGAVIAGGAIAPEGATRVVQHLEGGIIDEILVEEGNRVARGAPLIRLKDVRARAQYEILSSQAYQLTIVGQRLMAEQRGDSQWRPIPAPVDSAQVGTVDVQISLFDLNRRALREEIEMLTQRISELEAGIAMTQSQIDVGEHQRRLLQRELEMTEALYKKGLMTLPQLLLLQRSDAELDANLIGRRGNIDRARVQIGFHKMQMKNVETKYYARISKELEDNTIRQAELTRKLQDAEDVLRRTIIFAPVDGTVTQLRHRTIGAVLQPGEPVLYLVPTKESLVVEARIRPIDVDAVESYQSAQVRLLAYNQRKSEPIAARVKTVSPDLVTDQRSGEKYYLARLEISPQLAEAGQVPRLTAGMPVEVMISTESNSIIKYLVAPIADVFRRSLRES